LEELGLSYELKMLPFPPRVFAKEYLGLNPLGTIPLLLDGDTRMTESAAIAQYLVMRYGELEPQERRNPQVAADYTKWFFGRLRGVEAAVGKSDVLCAGRFTADDISVGYALLLAYR